MDLRNYGKTKVEKPVSLKILDSESNLQTAIKTNDKNKIKQTIKKTTKKNIHKDHRSRLKSQFLNSGFNSLSDIQKVELLLFYSIPQKDTNPIAHALLDEFGSIKDILSAEVNELIKVKGIKENSAILIKLISNLITLTNFPNPEDYISSTAKAKEFCSKLYVGVEVEQFYIICLTKSNRIKKVKLISSGTMDEVNVQIRNITSFALDTKCSRIIISHNHPNGKGVMSDEDCSFTYSLLCSCLLNSIDVLDHVIVGTDRAISLCEQQIMKRIKAKAVSTIQLPKNKLSMISADSAEYVVC